MTQAIPNDNPSPVAAPGHPMLARLLRREPVLSLGIRHARTTDIVRLAKASGVNLNLNVDSLKHFAARFEPAAVLLGADPMLWVLEGGEDFGLLAVFPQGASIPEEFTVIGDVSAQTGRRALVKIDGQIVNGARGFDHFSEAMKR